jgi:hypothetical protein
MLPAGAQARREKGVNGRMSPDDAVYLEERAEAQLELARKAKDPRAVQVHYDLANYYLDRLYGEADEAA